MDVDWRTTSRMGTVWPSPAGTSPFILAAMISIARLAISSTSCATVVRAGCIDAETVVLLHPNSPFLTRETLKKCLAEVVAGNK